MSDMSECVHEQLEWIIQALPPRRTFEEWYEDGQGFEDLLGKPGERDPNLAESVCHAVGYLRGVADALDQTVLEMLWAFSVEDRRIKKLLKQRGRAA